jgi:hypothetical protein
MRRRSLVLLGTVTMMFFSSANAILIEQDLTASFRFDLSAFGPDAEINSWSYDGPPNNSAPTDFDFLAIDGGFILSYGTSIFGTDIAQFTFTNTFSNPIANVSTSLGPNNVGVEELFISISFLNDTFTLPGLSIRIENNDPTLASTRVIGQFVGSRTLTSVPSPNVWGLYLLGLLYIGLYRSLQVIKPTPKLLS